jgi:squalene synthase HpnC
LETSEAYRHCLKVASSHYENFPVASLLLPKPQRLAAAAIYAFARQADDYADEPLPGAPAGNEAALRLKLLDYWEACLDRQVHHPVFIALQDSIQRYHIPVQRFRDLISAFKQDATVTRYETFDEVLAYCRRSADPVGRLILRLFNKDDARSVEESDAICTALQLANFWQDLGQDLRQRNRLYLPLEDCRAFGVSEEDLLAGHATTAFRGLMAWQIGRTRRLFARGEDLPGRIGGRLGLNLKLVRAGGLAICDKVRDLGYDTLVERPKLGKRDWMRLVWRNL